MITASHNPKEYNGYKVYWKDGGQLVEPQASGIIEEVNNTDEFDDVKVITREKALASRLLTILSDELDSKYLESVKKETILNNLPKDIKIVYSPSSFTIIPALSVSGSLATQIFIPFLSASSIDNLNADSSSGFA